MSWGLFTFFVILGLALIVRYLRKISHDLDSQGSSSPYTQANYDAQQGGVAAMRLRAQQQSAGNSPRQIHVEYHRHRRFFQEARDGLVAFAQRIEDADNHASLTSNDVAQALLYAQKGLNKVEEYSEALTGLFWGESSQQKAASMLLELRQDQRNVITHIEQFYAKLEATEGYTYLTDEFARWYVNRVEPHIV